MTAVPLAMLPGPAAATGRAQVNVLLEHSAAVELLRCAPEAVSCFAEV